MVSANQVKICWWILKINWFSILGLDLVVKGQFQPRLFLPLSSQQMSGRVVEITKDARGIGVSLTIKTSCGRIVQAGRGVVFAFGWWLGEADLASCLQDGKSFSTYSKHCQT